MKFVKFALVYMYVSQQFVHGQVSEPDLLDEISGRLEVYHSRRWGTVCDDGFDENDATVACRQLGYCYGKAAGNAFKYGCGQIWLKDLGCKGSESKLIGCNHPEWGPRDCDHNEDVRIICTHSGKLDGKWGLWSPWTDCTVPCGGGTKTRKRQCDSPTPCNGGLRCSGNSTENLTCNSELCIVDGNWAIWSRWTDCTKSCEGGTKTRQRQCDDPAPLNGGESCSGDSNESRACNDGPCPVNGNWASWSNWTDCTEFSERWRSCDDPAPEYGGDDCEGNPKEDELCKLQCPEESSNYAADAIVGVSLGSIILTTAIILLGQCFFPKLRITQDSCRTCNRDELHENTQASHSVAFRAGNRN